VGGANPVQDGSRLARCDTGQPRWDANWSLLMKVAYFDCFCGAGGDMIVASLIDAGADLGALRDSLAGLGVEGYSLSAEPVRRHGLAARRFHVNLDREVDQPHRNLQDITALLGAARLPGPVLDRARQVFARLAEAEANVHGTTTDQVHFHEVGAVDAIVDVTAAVSALHQLGIDRVVCSPIPTGSGSVVCQHGVLPVPAPATAQLLRGIPLAATDEVGELVTPTAAAVLTTLSSEFGSLPEMTLEAIGYGAGAREDTKRPNVLRVLIGSTDTDPDVDSIAILETNLDDASPEVIAYCLDRVRAGGALDAYAVPIQMKKSRPGFVLSVLCEPARVGAIERILFAETPTFGIRRHQVSRVKMRRRHEAVSTPFGAIRMKVGERGGVLTAGPEYEDCRAAAERHHVPLREVMHAATTAWSARSEPASER
jgi:uncharacterized protein (TIGR00299 family) protein